MAIVPLNVTKTVTTAGTRVQLSADASLAPSSIYVEADGANTGFIYLGLVDVASSKYIARLSPGQGIMLNSDSIIAGGRNGLQLSALYIDSSIDAQKVQLTYMYGV